MDDPIPHHHAVRKVSGCDCEEGPVWACNRVWGWLLAISLFWLPRIQAMAQTEEEERISELRRREILGTDESWTSLEVATYLPGVLLLIGVALLVIFLVRGRPMV